MLFIIFLSVENFLSYFFYHISIYSKILIIFFYHIFWIISYFFLKLGFPVEILYNLWLLSLQSILSRYAKQERLPPKCSNTTFVVQEFRHAGNGPKLKFAHRITNKKVLKFRKILWKIFDSSFLASFCSYDE